MSGPVRVLYVINALDVGGTEGQLMMLVEGLDRGRVLPHICCLHEGREGSPYDAACPALTLGVPRIGSFRALRGLVRLIRYLERQRIDVVQTFFIEGTLLGAAAGALAPSVSAVVAAKRDLGFAVTGGALRKLRIAYRGVDRFLANSKSVKRYLIERERVDPARIDIIYNGIDTERHERMSRAVSEDEIRRAEGIDPAAPIVGICANLNREVKRVDLFLHAAARVCGNRQDVVFLVIGEGELRSGLQELAKRLGIETRTRFLGSRRNPAPFIRVFSVGVISSDSEGFSNSIMEYMSLGIPVVATDVGGNPELVQDGVTGMLVPPGDAAKMADAIETLIGQPSLMARAGRESARILRERFSRERMIRDHEEYYESLVSRRR